jgi:hypothetical protein
MDKSEVSAEIGQGFVFTWRNTGTLLKLQYTRSLRRVLQMSG